MFKNKRWLVIFAVILTNFILKIDVYAEPSMRRCMILPVKDSVGGAIGFKVYEQIERYLQSSRWCFYQPNSEIINILSNYRNTLDQALENPEVLKILSQKTNAGSLIKVRLESLTKGMKVETTVLGANGSDIYFNQVTDIESDEIEVIAQTVNNWLDVYEKNIPYDARVLGVLGSQFTIDLGQVAGLYNGYEVQVVRPVKKQRHPLLKEVVDWKTLPVAKAKIFHVGQSQSQANVISYDRETLVQNDDWVLVTKNTANEKLNEKLDYSPETYNEENGNFGKLGKIGLSLVMGSGSIRVEQSDTKALSGLNIGVAFNTEIWATRNYWFALDIDKQFGSHSKDEGNLENDSNSLSYSKFKLKGGYKYLPLGFFYGPQVDLYTGYASYTYAHDVNKTDGIGEFSYSGIILGVRGSVPVVKDVRASIGLDFMLFPSFDESVTSYGDAESVSNYQVEILGEYKYSPTTDLEGGFEYISNSAEFDNATKIIKDKNFNIKAGAKFNF